MTLPTLSRPTLPWIQSQRWHDLLFAHWPVAPAALRPSLPPSLELDTWEGEAWVGVVPFRMSHIRLRGVPPLPYGSAFAELNVRTYVRCGGYSGVWFFSLDAENSIAVTMARRYYHLPYFYARMRVENDGPGIRYSSRRINATDPPAELIGDYRPLSEPIQAVKGTLEHWLTERYCLFSADREGRLYRGDIHHEPWPLQPAEAEFRVNTMAASHGILLPETPPLLHFARRLDVKIWPLLTLKSGS